jgi:ketosteroid isomerase-like protein
MTETQNVEVVKNAYAAFQRGDIAAVLASLALEFAGRASSVRDHRYQWQANVTAQKVAEFFKSVGEKHPFFPIRTPAVSRAGR